MSDQQPTGLRHIRDFQFTRNSMTSPASNLSNKAVSVIESPIAPEPRCPLCRDAGWLRRDVPLGHPDFAKLVLCECQTEAAKARWLTKLLHTSGLTEAMGSMTFSSFKPSHPSLAEALSACAAYAAEPDGWLYLYGGYGTGKTHLLAAMAQTLVERRIGALYVVVPELLDRIRQSFDPDNKESFSELWDRIFRADVLLLDDLGSERMTGWVAEKLFLIVDNRYRARAPMVIASNVAPEQFGGRIGSRITDVRLTTILGIAAGDYRKGGRA